MMQQEGDAKAVEQYYKDEIESLEWRPVVIFMPDKLQDGNSRGDDQYGIQGRYDHNYCVQML